MLTAVLGIWIYLGLRGLLAAHPLGGIRGKDSQLRYGRFRVCESDQRAAPGVGEWRGPPERMEGRPPVNSPKLDPTKRARATPMVKEKSV